jgi:hypothetical protein
MEVGTDTVDADSRNRTNISEHVIEDFRSFGLIHGVEYGPELPAQGPDFLQITLCRRQLGTFPPGSPLSHERRYVRGDIQLLFLTDWVKGIDEIDRKLDRLIAVM